MRVCWASSLGDCSGGITREHLVTESVFAGKEISVNGLPWCRTKTVIMLPTNLTANILCQHHNNGLSSVDEAGLAAFNVFRTAGEIQEARRQESASRIASHAFPVVQHEIDGHKLERWLLKTLINYEMVGDQSLSIGPPSPGSGHPPKELVEIAFGRKIFQPPTGLYFLGRVGEPLHLAERIQYTAWVSDSNAGSHVTAGQFLFYNCSFVLNVDPSRSLPQQLETEYGMLNLLYRPKGFDIMLNEKPSQRITFRW